MSELLKLRSRLADLCEQIEDLGDSWIREVIRRNVLTNYFMTAALLCSYPDSNALRPTRTTSKVAEIYMRSGLKEAELEETRLVAIVRLFASVAFGSKEEIRQDRILTKLKEVERDLSSDRSSFVMPYDPQRYSYLVRQIKHALIARS